jgi:hypothetical protein
MTIWREVDLRGIYLGDRIIGFSVPVERRIAIISYEGVSILDVNEPPTLLVVDTSQPEGGDRYDQSQQVLTQGTETFPILGLFGGVPILRNDYGEEAFLGTTKDVLQVRDAGQHIVLAFEFEDLSGDWRYATFSPDGTVLVLGVPYDLHVFHRVP